METTAPVSTCRKFQEMMALNMKSTHNCPLTWNWKQHLIVVKKRLALYPVHRLYSADILFLTWIFVLPLYITILLCRHYIIVPQNRSQDLQKENFWTSSYSLKQSSQQLRQGVFFHFELPERILVRLKIQLCTCLKRQQILQKRDSQVRCVCVLLLQKRCNCKVLKINLKRFEPRRAVRKKDFG